MNSTSIPPTIIRNRIYENQKLWLKNPVIIAIKVDWINKIIPIDRGCVININVSDMDKFMIIRKIRM